jgi:hypothetical protein
MHEKYLFRQENMESYCIQMLQILSVLASMVLQIQEPIRIAKMEGEMGT